MGSKNRKLEYFENEAVKKQWDNSDTAMRKEEKEWEVGEVGRIT